MELKLKAPYEPLTIEIGDKKIEARIDVTVDNLLDLGEVCRKADQKVKAMQKLYADAMQSKNVAKAKQANKEIAEVIEPAIKAGIGEEAYDAIVAACGAGQKIDKAHCNIVMVQVLGAIYRAVMEQKENALNEKAAHYLAEVPNAQPEPDKEQ